MTGSNKQLILINAGSPAGSNKQLILIICWFQYTTDSNKQSDLTIIWNGFHTLNIFEGWTPLLKMSKKKKKKNKKKKQEICLYLSYGYRRS